MAREFPHAQVLGVDLVPVSAEPETLPDNCQFEVADINLGLAHFEGQWDLVHVRFVGSGFKDFLKVLSDVEKCLKPGGLVLWLDADYDMLATTSFTYSRPPASELNPSGAWFVRMLYGWPLVASRKILTLLPEMRRSLVMGGSDLHTMEKTLDEGLWNRPILDPETFVNIIHSW
jgi:SAM-dependent methyltransferase